MQASAYWIEVNQTVGEIRADVARQTRQPRDGQEVYIVSVRRKGVDPAWKADVVSLAPLKLAAQRLVENSHRLATDEEIEAYEHVQKEGRKAAAVSADRQAKTVRFDAPKEVEAK